VLDAYLLGLEPPSDSKKPVTVPSHAEIEIPAAKGAPL
jgi:hypothetical protein